MRHGLSLLVAGAAAAARAGADPDGVGTRHPPAAAAQKVRRVECACDACAAG
eukprot:gene12051-12198_t